MTENDKRKRIIALGEKLKELCFAGEWTAEGIIQFALRETAQMRSEWAIEKRKEAR